MDTLAADRANLRALLDRYLLADLRRLRSLPSDGTRSGDCLYPLALTLMAAIEFSGALLDDAADYNIKKNEHYFTIYWQRCLFKGRAVAQDAGAVYNLLRHGLAHLYLPKGDLGVVRDPSAVVLGLDDEGRRSVNVDALAVDYEAACRRDFLDGPLPDAAVVRRFKQIVGLLDGDAARTPFVSSEPITFGAASVCSFANNAAIRQM
jgi:hypothetical protein